jgi:hypothetical protein
MPKASTEVAIARAIEPQDDAAQGEFVRIVAETRNSLAAARSNGATKVVRDLGGRGEGVRFLN